MILAGDVGGTKTNLGLFEADGESLRSVREATTSSRAHGSLREIIDAFLGKDRPTIEAACFAVAGPVIEGRCQTTNLPWVLDEKELGAALGTPHAKLLNDLEGTAFGMLYLPPKELVLLHEGRRPALRGNIAVIAAGTGLGGAYLYWDGKCHHPIATEGGHSDFAPRTDVEVELLRHLRTKLGGRVSYERVLSGPGVHEIYLFLRDSERHAETPEVARQLAAGDPSAVISQAASKTGDALCVATMNLFCELYGAEAGNMALRALTYGGVYLGGGIAPKNVTFLQNGSFMRGFADKGRLSALMLQIDVWVSLEQETALLGAAHYALHLATR